MSEANSAVIQRVCPVCRSANGVAQSVEAGAGSITIIFKCSNCIARWSDEPSQPSNNTPVLEEGDDHRVPARNEDWLQRWQTDRTSSPPEVKLCVVCGSSDIAKRTHGSVVLAECRGCGAVFEVHAHV